MQLKLRIPKSEDCNLYCDSMHSAQKGTGNRIPLRISEKSFLKNNKTNRGSRAKCSKLPYF